MTRKKSAARPARAGRSALAGASMLAAALAVELVDELVDGTKGAAFPLIRHDLALSYGQIGLLASVPLLLGSLLELPLGVLAGHGRRQRIAVLAGGVVFIASLAGAAVAHSFAALLVAFVVFFPASGAFVSLTESGLMDADPARQEQHMARWNLAGSAGAVAGPFLLIVVLAAGGSWRAAYLVLAGFAVLAWLGIARSGPRALPPPAGSTGDADQAGETGRGSDAGSAVGTDRAGDPDRAGATRRIITALRQPWVIRWLVLLQLADLLLDVLTGFLAVYLVDVVHVTPAEAALGVGVRLVAGLAGDAAVIPLLNRADGLRILTASAAAAAVLYPAFLLVPGLWPKLTVLAGLSIATGCWYPLLQARLYGSLPGQSGVAVTLTSAAALAGGTGPLAVGFLAERFGLTWALACLALAPVCLLIGLRRRSGIPPGQGQPARGG